MVRNASRKLKFGVQSRFYPISTVGFRTFSPENFGQAYWPLAQKLMTAYLSKSLEISVMEMVKQRPKNQTVVPILRFEIFKF